MFENSLLFLEEKKFGQLKTVLIELNPADIALFMEEIPLESLPVVFRILPKALAAETFSFMESDLQEHLIHSFSDSELKAVIDELYLDDAVDIIEEMPANVVKRILRSADPDTRKMINEILKFPEDSAGSIMTIEFVSLRKKMTVKDALRRIRRTGLDKETIYTCYVTSDHNRLVGIVTAKALLLADEDDIIGDIMEDNPIYAVTTDDKEDVANTLHKYDFLALPVVDEERRLVGIVTVDDAMDVLQEEATEDIEKMAAILPGDKPYLKTNVFELFKNRIPWLLLLMLSATFTQMIIRVYESSLAAHVILTSFIPMLMGTGGNSGSQASVTVIRGLSLGELEFSDTLRILWKETRVAILCGLTLAIASFFKVIWVDGASMTVSFVVSMTILMTVLTAKITGCLLPMLADKLGFDPAVMANPFITTIVDALSLVIYFNVASGIIGF
ncbi:MAG: magnesium transporter [Clostridia bacterium]|nr:magnesium transporter [Clostridia bacterium]